MFTLPNKILRFQIVALPRLENWDVMIDVVICPSRDRMAKHTLFLVVRETQGCLRGAVFILPENKEYMVKRIFEQQAKQITNIFFSVIAANREWDIGSECNRIIEY